jgi:hypothetical protein
MATVEISLYFSGGFFHYINADKQTVQTFLTIEAADISKEFSHLFSLKSPPITKSILLTNIQVLSSN